MDKILLPQNVADAIESSWVYIQSIDANAKKHMALNDWTRIAECCAEEAAILKPYAEENPVTYMTALFDGYDIAFDKDMSFNINGVELEFSYDIDEGFYTTNTPLKIAIGTAFEILTIGEAKEISDNINVLIQELKKVREN